MPLPTLERRRCPAGGAFGRDTDALPGCKDCDKWDPCDAVKHAK